MTTQRSYLPALTTPPAQAEQWQDMAGQPNEAFLRDDARVRELALALRSVISMRKPANRDQTESLVRAVADHLYSQRSISRSAKNGGLPSSSLEKVLAYIHANLDRSITLAEVAELANISPYHFTRLFKKSTGHSVHQYIIQQRIEIAKRLIHEGQLSLGEISLRAGFFDQSHLHRHFKRHVGTTPAAFAELCKNVQ
ncbi:MAG: AraC family transcriptional regulator [Caldilineaceae bacterium]